MSRFVRSWSAISRSLPQFAPARCPHARRRLRLERLEDRSLLSTIPLTVNTLSDDPAGPVSGQTTLRDAIMAADAGSSANKYVIKFAVDGTIALANQLPDLANNIVIKGPGAPNLAIQGNNTFTILTVNSGETVKISGVTIEDGSGFYGGGISNTGTLTVIDSTFIDNSAVNGGGGIFNYGILTVSDSVFINNSASNNVGIGGGISNLKTLTVNDDTFVGNSAFSGGGIFTQYTTTINNSVFVHNSAESGGGISTYQGVGIQGVGAIVVTINNSIFAYNSAGDAGDGGDGGGIYAYGYPRPGAMIVKNSIFAYNSAGDGGGIYIDLVMLTETGNLFIDNTGGDIN